MDDGSVTLSLCGDVMLGRGVDQILPHPGDPALREGYVRDARVYVELAEEANGPIPRPVGFSWPWGEARAVLDAVAPGAWVINLETSITRHDTYAPGRGIHYRMHPANLPALAAGRPDVCVLANNHVLDFGPDGLAETLATLAGGGLRTAGAGGDAEAATRPGIVPLDGGRRVLVFSFGMPSSGIPRTWAATARRGGVAFAAGPTDVAAAEVIERVRRAKWPGDVAVASVHWGSNWGYEVSREQIAFAHALVNGGVDVVHGHSSHHPRPLELYRGKLILHGCGDFIDDYEGITGFERYRDDLRPLYLATLDPDTGRLHALRIVPLQARRMRLRHASSADRQWLRALFDEMAEGFRPCGAAGGPDDAGAEGAFTLRPAAS